MATRKNLRCARERCTTGVAQVVSTRGQAANQNEPEESDLKVAEWDVLTQTPPASPTKDFRVTRVPAPSGFGQYFEDTVLLEKLREVRALLAFTRIESKGDFADAAYVDDGRETPLSRESPTWLPASEVRGEGIFLRLKENALQSREQRPEVRALEQDFLRAHMAWRTLPAPLATRRPIPAETLPRNAVQSIERVGIGESK